MQLSYRWDKIKTNRFIDIQLFSRRRGRVGGNYTSTPKEGLTGMTVDVGVLNEADPPVTWRGMGLHVLAFPISCLNFCVCFSNISEVYKNRFLSIYYSLNLRLVPRLSFLTNIPLLKRPFFREGEGGPKER